MLTGLRIENFLIVKNLELDFLAKMTVFTGETGAGKSIMIDALTLALGGRADASIIRKGQDRCDITATFYSEESSEPVQWLVEHDFECSDGVIILRRVLNKEGRSKCYINGQPFPLQKVKELSNKLVHIHGQHQHQALMHPNTHREQLDSFAGHTSLLEQVHLLHTELQTIQAKLNRLTTQKTSNDRQELLEFQIAELSQLAVQEDEAQHLSQEHQLLYHAYDYQQRCEQIEDLLINNEAQVNRSLNQILTLLKELPKDNSLISNTIDLINSALIQCDEAVNEINQFKEQIQLDPERLQHVENRLAVLHQMARKYHVEVQQIPAYLISLQTELDTLLSADKQILILQKQYDSFLQQYNKAALELRQSRMESAVKLATEINTIIQSLGMPQAQLIVDITPTDKMHYHGLDKIEYKATTNKGAELDLLSKIASGGELSRISLAIQVITAQRGSTPTLMFDEVDVGIGGATAALVGRLLQQLGERLQVFCVTHQPQVAAHAHHHFVVEKFTDSTETYTTIESVIEENKIDEIARMLGGLTITKETRLNAQDLLEQSRSKTTLTRNLK